MAPPRALAIVTIALCALATLVLWPYAGWLILALWVADLVRPLHRVLSRVTGGRSGIAAGLTVVLLGLVLVPVVILAVSLALDAIALVEKIAASPRAQDLFAQLGAPGDQLDVKQLMSHADRAWSILRDVGGTAAHAGLGLVIFAVGVYTSLVDGARWWAWAVAHSPIGGRNLGRLAGAFLETGRGLFVGIGGAGIAQSLVATVAFVAIGVPHPLALGFLTLVCSIIPAIGTSLVWVPVAIGLALDGRTTEAVILVVVGVTLISTVDNLVRPLLIQRGSLQLPMILVLAAMFGGAALLGAWGLFLGPLAVRLAKEGVVLWSEHHGRRSATAHSSGHSAGRVITRLSS